MPVRRFPLGMSLIWQSLRALARPAATAELVRRRVPEGTLSWQFPAGELEPGESAEDAAVRETREEVGLVVAPQATIGGRVHPVTGRWWIYVGCCTVRSTATVVDSDELAELIWCPVGEVEKC